MNLKLHYLVFSILLLSFCNCYAQNITLFNQFNGRYDFTFVGNTMNLGENNITPGCSNLLVTSSSASLNLNPNQEIKAAYLYWAGSGFGDFDVKLNSETITPQRTFSNVASSTGLSYFSAFAEVTDQVIATGNGTYTLSDFSITQTLLNITGYCNNRTNFAGWAMVIIHKDLNLPLNQINVYDGLQSIPTALNITLNSLNVIDNNDAQIGFIAWEGDSNLAINETLRINGNILSNPPLNPANNAFNGTNSITNSATLFNMDLDVYNIQNNINIGDNTALIQLTSGQDVVLINVVVTKLNSQLPDATIAIETVNQSCNSKNYIVDYTVSNLNSTNPLAAGTPIAIYANGILVGQTQTQNVIPIDGSENGQISIILPDAITIDFVLTFVVDDNGTGTGIVLEIAENNNDDIQSLSQWFSPDFNELQDLFTCNEGFNVGTFNFSDYANLVLANATDNFIGFYETLADATNNTNPISNTTNYNTTAPKELFIRIENDNCFNITSFNLRTKNCAPTIYNYVSANTDGFNDTFFIDGLRNVFVNFELEIYNRWGRLIWKGNNNTYDWDGTIAIGPTISSSLAPKGTYFYLLNLNDVDYPNPLVGWLYFTK